MEAQQALRDIATARAGDKGNTSNISLWVNDPADYARVAEQVTAEAVKRHFGDQVKGHVVRYDLPALGGFNFVLTETLDGGVNTSLNLDSHGKSFSFILLAMPIT